MNDEKRQTWLKIKEMILKYNEADGSLPLLGIFPLEDETYLPQIEQRILSSREYQSLVDMVKEMPYFLEIIKEYTASSNTQEEYNEARYDHSKMSEVLGKNVANLPRSGLQSYLGLALLSAFPKTEENEYQEVIYCLSRRSPLIDWINARDTVENSAQKYRNDQRKAELLKIKKYDGMTVKQYIAFLTPFLEKRGYHDILLIDRGNIDFMAKKGELTVGFKVKIQTKKVGDKPIVDTFLGMEVYGCNKGIVITNRYFTEAAIKCAEANGIVLWDRIFVEDNILE